MHVLVEPAADDSLDRIVHSWKSYAAHQANRVPRRNGAFWHRDYFDRYIRDEGHLSRTIDYIENNPVKAGLASGPLEWRWSSARLRA